MKNFIFTFIGLFIPVFVFCQTISWVREFDPIIRDIAIDNNKVLLTGEYSLLTDFDPGPNVHNLSTASSSYEDGYILEISSNGDFISVTSTSNQGVSTSVGPYQIETYGFGKRVVAGELYGKSDFDPGVNHFILDQANDSCSSFSISSLFCWGLNFDNSLDYAGSFCMDGIPWASGIGGLGEVQSISTYSEGFALSGCFEIPADFDYGIGEDIRTPDEYNPNEQQNPSDIFISKYSELGNHLWTKVIRGKADQRILSSVMDEFGNIYISGYSQAIFFSMPTYFENEVMFEGTPENGSFLIKIDPFGNLVWVRNLSSGVHYSHLAIDNNGNIYATGSFTGERDFDSGLGEHLMDAGNSSDIFVLRLFPNGELFSAFKFGDPDYPEQPSSLEVDNEGNLFITGWFKVITDLDPSLGSYVLNSANGQFDSDEFLAKFNPFNGLSWGVSLDGSLGLIPIVKVSSLGEVYVVNGSHLTKFGLLPSNTNEIQESIEFRISPNPAENNICIDFFNNNFEEPVYYEVINLLGEIFCAGVFSSEQKKQIDISRLSTGVYYVKIKVKNKISYMKFIKV